MKNQPIGIIDSGFGGLHIWQEIITQLPTESTIYIADSLYCPYGDRGREEIHGLAKRLVNFLIKKHKVKLIVLACNTITVSCLEILRNEFKEVPIIGIVPVVKTAVEKTRNGRIGILSTNTTARSNYQKHLIKTYANGKHVISVGTNKLVPLIEQGEISGERIHKVLRESLAKFKEEKVDTIALGCSHFPFLKKEMEKLLGKDVLLLDSAGAVGRQVQRILEHNGQLSHLKTPKHVLFTTKHKAPFVTIAKQLLSKDASEKITKIEAVTI